MRILVPIKQVPETNAVRMDEQTGTMIREGVEAIVNPLDLYAIELAIRLREAHSGEVVAVSMGPPKAAAALREAVAMGCDAGILVSDKAFAGSDTWATSYVLAAAVRRIVGSTDVPPPRGVPPVAGSPYLIICGERATDGDTGQVGPGIASFLDLPVATYVSRVDELHESSCRVHRLVEDGYEILDVELPALLTVVKEVADPRLPTLRGKQRSRRMEIPTWGAGELDVEPGKLGLDGSPTRVVKIFRPTVARECIKLRPADERGLNDAADQLVEFLQSRDLI